MLLIGVHDKIFNFDRYSSLVEQDIMGGVMGQPVEEEDVVKFKQFAEKMKEKCFLCGNLTASKTPVKAPSLRLFPSNLDVLD